MANILVGLALVTGVILLVKRHRPPSIRRAILRAHMVHTGEASSEATLGATDPWQGHSMPRSNLLLWIRAAMTESSRSHRPWMRARVLLFAFMGAFTYVGGSLLGIIGMSVIQSSLQLSRAFAYPLSRKQRAMLRYACSAVDLATLGLVVAVTYWALESLRVPRTLFFGPVTPFNWRVELAALCVLLPIAQWPSAVKPPSLQPWPRAFIMTAVLLMIGAALVPRALMSALGDNTTAALAWLGLALVAVQGLYYKALRVVYARRDL